MVQNSKSTKHRMKTNLSPLPIPHSHQLPFPEANFGVFLKICTYKNKYLDCLSPNNFTIAKHYTC